MFCSIMFNEAEHVGKDASKYAALGNHLASSTTSKFCNQLISFRFFFHSPYQLVGLLNSCCLEKEKREDWPSPTCVIAAR